MVDIPYDSRKFHSETKMTYKFIPTNRDQQLLFPPAIQDWLPEKHLARFVVDIVAQLDLRPLAQSDMDCYFTCCELKCCFANFYDDFLVDKNGRLK